MRRSILKKLLASMERAVSDGLHRRTAGLEERVVWVDEPAERWRALVSLLSSLGPQAHVMVFVASPAEADATSNHLRANLPGNAVDIAATGKADTSHAAVGAWRVGAFHSKRSRQERSQTLAHFHQGGAGLGCVLVCTDALARGVDMARPVDVVVQLGPAENGSAHLHRVGRTARQGLPGVAVTIACRATEGDAAKVAAGQRAVLQEEIDEDAAGPTSLHDDAKQPTRAVRAARRALATKADRRRDRAARAAARDSS